MKKILSGIGIILFVIVGLIVSFSIQSYRRTRYTTVLQRGETDYLSYVQERDQFLMSLMESENITFMPVFYDENKKDSFNIRYANQPILCMYFSEISCNSCVEDVVKTIDQYRDSLNLNIVYLANYRRNRDVHIFRRINNLSSEIYNINSLNLPIEKMHRPFVFIVDQQQQIRSLFVPSKEYMDSFHQYLSWIKRRYDQPAGNPFETGKFRE